MKISDVKDVGSQMVQQYQKNDNYAAVSDKQVANATIKTEEKIEISTQAKDIQQARNTLDEVPDVREEKIQEIKNQINNGEYNVSGEKIAGKMVGESIVDLFA